jgi:hypothetical protein
MKNFKFLCSSKIVPAKVYAVVKMTNTKILKNFENFRSTSKSLCSSKNDEYQNFENFEIFRSTTHIFTSI